MHIRLLKRLPFYSDRRQKGLYLGDQVVPSEEVE